MYTYLLHGYACADFCKVLSARLYDRGRLVNTLPRKCISSHSFNIIHARVSQPDVPAL